jgi:hypothetical protein
MKHMKNMKHMIASVALKFSGLYHVPMKFALKGWSLGHSFLRGLWVLEFWDWQD